MAAAYPQIERFGNFAIRTFDPTTGETLHVVAPMTLYDDFNLSAFSGWQSVTSGAGANSIAVSAANGVASLSLTSANSIQSAALYHTDRLKHESDSGFCVEYRAYFNTLPTGGAYGLFGMASAHNADADAITQNVWFRFSGSGAATCESDDGSTDNDDIAAGVTVVANEARIYLIDATDYRDIRFFIDGKRVASGTTFTFANAPTQLLQPYIRVAKQSASTDVATLYVDYMRFWSGRV